MLTVVNAILQDVEVGVATIALWRAAVEILHLRRRVAGGGWEAVGDRPSVALAVTGGEEREECEEDREEQQRCAAHVLHRALPPSCKKARRTGPQNPYARHDAALNAARSSPQSAGARPVPECPSFRLTPPPMDLLGYSI